MNIKQFTTAFLLCLICCSTTAFAGGTGGFGFKGGLSISTIGISDEDFSQARNRFRLGGTGGISYEVATPGTFAFEVDMLYSLRGQKQEFNNVSLLGDGELKDYLHYINIPASFKFYIGDVFNVHFGGYAGLIVAGKRSVSGTNTFGMDYEDSDPIFSNESKDPVTGAYLMNRVEGGIHFGAEFVSRKGIGVGSRAYVGLNDITDDDHYLGNQTVRSGEVSVYAIFRLGANK